MTAFKTPRSSSKILRYGSLLSTLFSVFGSVVKHGFSCLIYYVSLCYFLQNLDVSRDGAVVRAVASHQCVPGSIPGPVVICGLSCCRFSTLLREAFLRLFRFPLSSKTNISKFQLHPGMHGHFLTSTCELLGTPRVNKLHLQLQLRSFASKYY